MKVTLGHKLLPILSILVGVLLMYAGAWLHWGPVWFSGGIFFITGGFSAILLTLGWVLPGAGGKILRHPIVNLLILAAVLGTMCITVFLGVFYGNS